MSVTEDRSARKQVTAFSYLYRDRNLSRIMPARAQCPAPGQQISMKHADHLAMWGMDSRNARMVTVRARVEREPVGSELGPISPLVVPG